MYSQKVYQINDHSARGLPLSEEKLADYSQMFARPKAERRKRAEKNPAVAAWISSIIWGGGLIYRDDINGMYFLLAQVIGLGALIVSSLFGGDISAAWVGRGLTEIFLVQTLLIVGLVGSMLAFSNIWIAYLSTQRSRREVFEGVDSFAAIVFGGFWLPGLGQLMNAQLKKAMLFMALPFVCFAGLVASAFCFVFWPHLKDPVARALAEQVIQSAAMVLMVTVGVGVLAFYDATTVNLHPGKRESLLKRMKCAYNRWGRYNRDDQFGMLIRFVGKQALLLIFLAGLIHAAWHFFPRDLYSQGLRQTAMLLEERGFDDLPRLALFSADRIEHMPTLASFYVRH